ncbi:MAG: hypothetical protein HZB51_12145 [Chloroflexi bacterium]|nr:hypothetical protein [Chloroflexota bacterium]
MNSSHISDEQLIAFAAKELGVSESEKISAHIAHCPECNSLVVLYKNVRGLMTGDRGQDPPSETVARAYTIFHPPLAKSQPQKSWMGGNWLETLDWMTRRLFAPVVTVLTLLLLFLVGTIVINSSTDSLPGDSLYPVKLNAEALQVALTLPKEEKVNLLLESAQKRMNEAAILGDMGRYDYIPTAIVAYENEVNQATNILNDLAATNSDLAPQVGEQIRQALNQDTVALTTLMSKVPVASRSTLQNAIVTSQTNSAHVDKTLNSMPAKPNASRTPRPSDSSAPSSTPKSLTDPLGSATPTVSSVSPDGGKPTEKATVPSAKPTEKSNPTSTSRPTAATGKPTEKINPTPAAKPTSTTKPPVDQGKPTDNPDRGKPTDNPDHGKPDDKSSKTESSDSSDPSGKDKGNKNK